jgi:hypothetical protein
MLDHLRRLSLDGELFALLDACDEPEIPARCKALPPDRAACLWQGEGQRDYWHVAPYLIRVTLADLDWIGHNFWNKPWGYFVVAHSEVEFLRTHFRRFMTIRRSTGETMLFRFYDPRVIRTFLSSRTDDQIRQFYGPARGFGITAPFELSKVELITP